MQVILLQDVPKVGKKHDVKEVPNGLARNFLIPQKFVEMATYSSLKKLEMIKEKDKKTEDEKNKIMYETLSALKDKTITITARAAEEGSLFAKITPTDIVNAIKTEHAVTIPEELIILEEPLKKIGEYEIRVGTEQNNILLKIQIVPEKN